MADHHESGMSKEEFRKHLSDLPFDEKLDILDKLRERATEIAEAREQLKEKLASEKRR